MVNRRGKTNKQKNKCGKPGLPNQDNNHHTYENYSRNMSQVPRVGPFLWDHLWEQPDTPCKHSGPCKVRLTSLKQGRDRCESAFVAAFQTRKCLHTYRLESKQGKSGLEFLLSQEFIWELIPLLCSWFQDTTSAQGVHKHRGLTGALGGSLHKPANLPNLKLIFGPKPHKWTS